MIKSKLTATIITVAFCGFFLITDSYACSMFKITMHGKTMVGNNEDYWNPNDRIWFEKGKKGEYGALYVGFDNFWPQGGMNQAGLVFDGFAEDYKAISDTLGKNLSGSQRCTELKNSQLSVCLTHPRPPAQAGQALQGGEPHFPYLFIMQITLPIDACRPSAFRLFSLFFAKNQNPESIIPEKQYIRGI